MFQQNSGSLKVSRLVAVTGVMGIILALGSSAWANWSNFTDNALTASPVIYYDTVGNWSGGVVNNTFSYSPSSNWSQIVTLRTNPTLAGGLTIIKTPASGAGTWQFRGDGTGYAAHTITLGGDVLLVNGSSYGNGNLTIGSNPIYGQNWSDYLVNLNLGSASRTVTTTEWFDTGSTYPNGTGILNGISGGNKGLTKAGPGALYLGGGNTYTGTVNVQQGLLIVGHNDPNTTMRGTLASTSITIGPLGGLMITNRLATTGSFRWNGIQPDYESGTPYNDRIANTATITLQGGLLSREAGSKDNAAGEEEVFGTLVLQSGRNNIMATYKNSGVATDTNSILHMGTLTRSPGTTAVFTGGDGTEPSRSYLGRGNTYEDSRILIDNGTTLNDGGIIPWAVTGAYNKYYLDGFAVYDATYGIKLATATNFADLNTATATDNASIGTTPNQTLNGNVTVNSLITGWRSTISGSGGTRTLKLNAGALAAPGPMTVNSSVILDFNNKEGFIHGGVAVNSSEVITLGGKLQNANGLTFDTNETVYLNNSGNTNLGTITINGGYGMLNGAGCTMVVLGNNTAIPVDSVVSIAIGGWLDVNAKSPAFAGLIGAGTVAASKAASAATATLTVGANDSSTDTFSGQIVLAGMRTSGGILNVTKTGTNTQAFNSINSYNGTTTINGGTLLANAPIVAAKTVSGTSAQNYSGWQQGNTLYVSDTSGLVVGQEVAVGTSNGGWIIASIVPNVSVTLIGAQGAAAFAAVSTAYTLNAKAGSSTGTGAVAVSNDGTLGGNGGVAGMVTASSTSDVNLATVSPGSSIGTLTVGNMTFGDNSRLLIEMGTGTGDKLIVLGDLEVTGTNTILDLVGNFSSSPILTFGTSSDYAFEFVRYNGTTVLWADALVFGAFGDGLLNLQLRGNSLYLIPEPASLSLLALAGAMLFRRRRE